MMMFWILAALLTLLALGLVLPALLASRKTSTPQGGDAARKANLSVLRDQLAALDKEFAAGSLNAEQLALARADIERRALEEESVPEVPVVKSTSRATAISVGLAVPLLAIGIYGFLGSPFALDPVNTSDSSTADVSPAQVEEMVKQFAARLENLPPGEAVDPKAWEMLARSYAAMQKFPEANKAYKRAVELAPGNAQLLADHADVMAMLQGQSTLGEPAKLIARALQLDPNNLKVLALAGSAAFESRDFPQAIAHWTKARKLAPEGSDFASGLDRSLAEARAAAGGPAVLAQAAPDAANPVSGPSIAAAGPAATAGIEGTVSVSPALAGKLGPDDTVFIFARAAQGPRMPLAILKRKASELPITFKLDDSTAMSDEMKLSKFDQVIVGARVSKSGNAMPQAGDLVGQSSAVKSNGSKLSLVIDAVQP
jgi:cytochrome c-type biogenesis protein CcmH